MALNMHHNGACWRQALQTDWDVVQAPRQQPLSSHSAATQQRLSRRLGCVFALVNHLVYQTVVSRFLGGHEVVTLGVALDAL